MTTEAKPRMHAPYLASPCGAGAFLVACLCLIFLLNLTGIVPKTLTYDEPWHLMHALWFAQGHPERIADAQMPFSVLNAAPVFLLDHVPGDKHALEEFALQLKGAPLVAARLMTSLCSLVLATIVFFWARDLYGPQGAKLSLLLYTFSPNILAHSRLITTDLFATLMITASLYTLWSFFNRGGWSRGVICSTALGISQLAKYSCGFLYAIFLCLGFIRWLPDVRSIKASKIFGKMVGSFIIAGLTSTVIIQAGFLFHGVFEPLSSYQFRSDLFRDAQRKLGALASAPIPLPHSYLQGLDWVVSYDATGQNQGRIYLLGERRQGRGFYLYYVIALLFKVPLAGVVLFGWAMTRLRFKNWKTFCRNEVFLLGPCLFLFVYFSFFFNTQIGLRYLLPAFPLVFVFCGSVAANWEALARSSKISALFLVSYFAASSLSYHPHYISYFNELLTDRKMAYRILADSNLEWGENLNYVHEYLEAHPEAKVNPVRPVNGHVVVGANNLVGIFADHDENELAWLRDHFEPVGHIAYGWLVFDISADDLKNLMIRNGVELLTKAGD